MIYRDKKVKDKESDRMVDIKEILLGKLDREEIKQCIQDERWQKFRIGLKGMQTSNKINLLMAWVNDNLYSYKSRVQITNYYNALKRGGLV